MSILSFVPPYGFDVWNELVIEDQNGIRKIYLNPRRYNHTYNWGKELSLELQEIEIDFASLKGYKLFINDDKNRIHKIENFESRKTLINERFIIITSLAHLKKRLKINSVDILFLLRKFNYRGEVSTNNDSIEICYPFYMGLCRYIERNGEFDRADRFFDLSSYATSINRKLVEEENWRFLKETYLPSEKAVNVVYNEQEKYFIIPKEDKHIIYGYRSISNYKSISDYLRLLIDEGKNYEDYEIRYFENQRIHLSDIKGFKSEFDNLKIYNIWASVNRIEEKDIFKKKENRRTGTDHESNIMRALKGGYGDRYGF